MKEERKLSIHSAPPLNFMWSINYISNTPEMICDEVCPLPAVLNSQGCLSIKQVKLQKFFFMKFNLSDSCTWARIVHFFPVRVSAAESEWKIGVNTNRFFELTFNQNHGLPLTLTKVKPINYIS